MSLSDADVEERVTSPSDANVEDLLRPMNAPTRKYYLVAGAALFGILLWASGYVLQLQYGLIVTNLGDWGSPGGVTWGLYIGSFIWWVGIAHGGIIISAAVRLMKLKTYEPVARMAELLTIGALSVAGVLIVIHLGRPDRVVTSIIPQYHITVHTSPLTWDLTVITLYFVMTATYLALTLRYDITRLRGQLPERFSPIYDLLTVRYDQSEDEIVERMVWWLALGIIILAPLLLHGGVIPWLFALTPSMPGWYGGLTATQFLSAALSSAMGGVILVAYAFRQAYDWEVVLPDEVFWGLGKWAGIFALLFIWLQIHDVLTGIYASPLDVEQVTMATITEPFYWLAIVLMVGSLAFLAFQSFGAINYSMKGTVLAALAIIVGVLIEKTLFVVEGIMYPATDLYDGVPGIYVPSWIELAALIGMTGIVVLFFLVVSKIIPIVELHVVEGDH